MDFSFISSPIVTRQRNAGAVVEGLGRGCCEDAIKAYKAVVR
jgi:hypothetical protein